MYGLTGKMSAVAGQRDAPAANYPSFNTVAGFTVAERRAGHQIAAAAASPMTAMAADVAPTSNHFTP